MRVTQDLTLEREDSLVVESKFSCSVTYGIFVPWLGIEPMPPALQGKIFYH